MCYVSNMAKRSRRDSLSSISDESAEPPQSLASRNTPAESPPPAKITSLGATVDPAAPVMRCSLPPHRESLTFANHEDYENHYLQAHVNRCVECGKNFPTPYFLNIHIEENHDSLILALRDRGEKTVHESYVPTILLYRELLIFPGVLTDCKPPI